jgi:hypothetical protein
MTCFGNQDKCRKDFCWDTGSEKLFIVEKVNTLFVSLSYVYIRIIIKTINDQWNIFGGRPKILGAACWVHMDIRTVKQE